MRIVYLSFILCFSSLIMEAQKQNVKQSILSTDNVHLNLFGDISLLSFNYEKEFAHNNSYRLLGGIGLGINKNKVVCIFNDCTEDGYSPVIAKHLSNLFGKKEHFLELGIGGSYTYDNEYTFYPILGYRFIPATEDKYFMRVYLSYPTRGLDQTSVTSLPFGISFGKRI